MRVARLELTGIGPFEAAVFAIPAPTKGTGELVLFEGPNGSGKTTVAEAIACTTDFGRWSDAPYEQFDRRFRGPGTLVVRFEQDDWWGVSRRSRVVGVGGRDSSDSTAWDTPLVFAYAGHQPTPVIATKGPSEIEAHPLKAPSPLVRSSLRARSSASSSSTSTRKPPKLYEKSIAMASPPLGAGRWSSSPLRGRRCSTRSPAPSPKP